MLSVSAVCLTADISRFKVQALTSFRHKFGGLLVKAAASQNIIYGTCTRADTGFEMARDVRCMCAGLIPLCFLAYVFELLSSLVSVFSSWRVLGCASFLPTFHFYSRFRFLYTLLREEGAFIKVLGMIGGDLHCFCPLSFVRVSAGI